MKIGSKGNRRVQLRVLSKDEINEIHLATLKILEDTGVKIFEPEAVELLRKAGSFIKDDNIVKIPSFLVEMAIQRAPEKITLYDREGEPAVFLENHKVYFGAGSDCPFVLDPFTKKRRPTLKKDIANAALICDYLPNIDFVMSLGVASDVPSREVFLYEFDAMASNTKKPIVFTAQNKSDLAKIIDMAEIIAGGAEELSKNPFILHYAEPNSPLMHSQEAMEKLLLVAERNIPVVYSPGLMAGATGPVTLAGSLAIANAETLSGLVVHQLKHEGAPFVYGGFVTIIDMSTSIFSHGAPEFHLMSAALADMAHYYKLPCWGSAGLTDSKIFDQQATIEATSSIMMALLSGANLVHDCGYVESGLTSCYEMIVAVDEIIGMAKRIVRGIEVNKETLALSVIKKVGPGGDFLTNEHTLRNFKQELWFPNYLDRNKYAQWMSSGKRTLGQKLNEKVKNILNGYTPEPFSIEIKAMVENLIKQKCS